VILGHRLQVKCSRVSAKPVADKLLVKPGASVWASPSDRLSLIEPLPDGARAVSAIAEADVALLVADDAEALERLFVDSASGLHEPDVFWIVYPKWGKADLKRDTIPPYLSRHGMRPIAQVAIDDVWSALRFRPLKAGERPFTGGGRG